MLHSRDSTREAWSSGVWQPGAPTRTAMGLASSIFQKITLDGSNGSSKSGRLGLSGRGPVSTPFYAVITSMRTASSQTQR